MFLGSLFQLLFFGGANAGGLGLLVSSQPFICEGKVVKSKNKNISAVLGFLNGWPGDTRCVGYGVGGDEY